MVAFDLDYTTNQATFSGALGVLGLGERVLAIDEAWSHVHPDDALALQRASTRIRSGSATVDVRFRWIRPDTRETRWIERRAILTRSDDGALRATHGVLVDVTDAVVAEQASRRAHDLEVENARAHHANRMKSAFMATISHELRTPLNAVVGFADVLMEDAGALSPEHQQYVRYIQENAEQLLRLINDVLDLSKIEAGTLEMQRTLVSVAQTIEEVRAILAPEAERAGVHVEVERVVIADDVWLDPLRFRQVLYNYLSNAIKFTPEGGRVVISADVVVGPKLRVVVEDTGIGIAPENIPRLFSDFSQLDNGLNRWRDGAGLGLALTRKLAALEGGSVGVESVLGKGSLFYVEYPFRSGEPAKGA